MNKQLIIGLGTGRCGTSSLAKLLNLQKSVNITHEFDNAPVLPWEVSVTTFMKSITTVESREQQVVGDIGFYWLPYVDLLLRRFPDCKFVVIQRPMLETIVSYERWTEGRNHWMQHAGDTWRHDRWDTCYPNYKLTTKRECLQAYYLEYYDTCASLPKDNTYYITMDDLNNKDASISMLQFCGFAAPSFTQIQVNQS